MAVAGWRRDSRRVRSNARVARRDPPRRWVWRWSFMPQARQRSRSLAGAPAVMPGWAGGRSGIRPGDRWPPAAIHDGHVAIHQDCVKRVPLRRRSTATTPFSALSTWTPAWARISSASSRLTSWSSTRTRSPARAKREAMGRNARPPGLGGPKTRSAAAMPSHREPMRSPAGQYGADVEVRVPLPSVRRGRRRWSSRWPAWRHISAARGGVPFRRRQARASASRPGAAHGVARRRRPRETPPGPPSPELLARALMPSPAKMCRKTSRAAALSSLQDRQAGNDSLPIPGREWALRFAVGRSGR